MRVRVDTTRFGPWALVTGASSGIGRAFADHLAANGINLVLAARRPDALDRTGRELAARHGIDYRAVPVDLADPDFLTPLAAATDGLDLGLVVSNAGGMLLGDFLTQDHADLLAEAQVNVAAHLTLAHHFGRSLATRGRGGIILVSSLVAAQGVPYMANYAATKAYVLALGEALHRELSAHGVGVTVLAPGATNTPMSEAAGAAHTPMGRLMMTAEACAADGLAALGANRAVRISGAVNRATIALTPRGLRVRLFGNINRAMAHREAALSGE